jgi:hypothetical protein
LLTRCPLQAIYGFLLSTLTKSEDAPKMPRRTFAAPAAGDREKTQGRDRRVTVALPRLTQIRMLLLEMLLTLVLKYVVVLQRPYFSL